MSENIVERFDPSTVFLRAKIDALVRISAELRGFFDDTARLDADVQAILRDCDTLDQIAAELAQARPANEWLTTRDAIRADGTPTNATEASTDASTRKSQPD